MRAYAEVKERTASLDVDLRTCGLGDAIGDTLGQLADVETWCDRRWDTNSTVGARCQLRIGTVAWEVNAKSGKDN